MYLNEKSSGVCYFLFEDQQKYQIWHKTTQAPLLALNHQLFSDKIQFISLKFSSI